LLVVLRWHGASAQVCALACLALTSLAPHGENYAYIRGSNGMQLVLRVFAQHRLSCRRRRARSPCWRAFSRAVRV